MTTVGGISAEHLRSFIERVERLQEEKAALSADIRDIFAEAKGSGFDTAIMRKLIAERRKEPSEVREQESLMDIYRRALGMGPLFDREAA